MWTWSIVVRAQTNGSDRWTNKHDVTFLCSRSPCRFETRAKAASTVVSTTGWQPRRLARPGSRGLAQRQFGVLSAGGARRTYQRTLEGKRRTKDPRRRFLRFPRSSARILSRFHHLEIALRNCVSSIEIRTNDTHCVKCSRHFDSSLSQWRRRRRIVVEFHRTVSSGAKGSTKLTENRRRGVTTPRRETNPRDVK